MTKKPKKILVVDDDAIFGRLLRDSLSKSEDIHVITAKDGQEGLETAKREIPDMILSDLMMPRMDGIEFIKRLRQQEALVNIPVFVISQMSQFEKISEGAQLGIKGYIVKSDLSMDSIVERIKKYL